MENKLLSYFLECRKLGIKRTTYALSLLRIIHLKESKLSDFRSFGFPRDTLRAAIMVLEEQGHVVTHLYARTSRKYFPSETLPKELIEAANGVDVNDTLVLARLASSYKLKGLGHFYVLFAMMMLDSERHQPPRDVRAICKSLFDYELNMSTFDTFTAAEGLRSLGDICTRGIKLSPQAKVLFSELENRFKLNVKGVHL